MPNDQQAPFTARAGYAEWAQVAGFLAAQTCPWDSRERVALTPSIKRSLRTKNPNRAKKPSNAAKVNAKRTKQAAKRAKHNARELTDAPAKTQTNKETQNG